jgi:uncharacterized RDD family membrane protein YckC
VPGVEVRKAGRVKRPTETRDVAFGLALVCGGVGVTVGKVALLPLRVVARSPLVGPALARAGESLADTGRAARIRGRAQIEAVAGEALASPEADRIVDSALAGPLPEAVARSLIERQVVQRITEQVLASAELEAAFGHAPALPAARNASDGVGFERLVAEALDSRVVADVADQVIESTEIQRLVEEIASSPAIRSALTRHTTTFAEETATAARRRMESLDDRAESRVHRWLNRQVAAGSPAVAYGGLGARGIAFSIDMAISLIVFLLGAAVGAVVASLVGGFKPAWLAEVLASVGWFAVVAAYLVVFWTVTGQTPGMRVMHLHVVGRGGGPPNLWRSVLRLIGLVLAIVPLFAGFVPVLIDKRRRALQDFMAGTVVRVEDDGPL